MVLSLRNIWREPSASIPVCFSKGLIHCNSLLDVVDNILAAQDILNCSFLVLLDFCRAFDSLSITLLLSKKSYYGFDSETDLIQWFDSYLSDRGQVVELRMGNGATVYSCVRPVRRGMSQCSILGPLLFMYLHSADIVFSYKYIYKIV